MRRDETEQLEDLLRGLPLRRPSSELDQRVCSVWRARTARWRRLTVGGAVVASAALAASILWMIVLLRGPVAGPGRGPTERVERPKVADATPRPPEPADRRSVTGRGDRPAEPVRIEQVWSTLAANEVVVPVDALPIRRVHRQIMRHVRWIDERRNVHIEWNIPGEETVVVPLQYN